MVLFVVCLGCLGLTECVCASDASDPPPNTVVTHGATHPVTKIRDAGGISFLFGAFCALWAQNTRRDPWLWFFLGLFFSVITVIALLVKNADDRFERRMYGRDHA